MKALAILAVLTITVMMFGCAAHLEKVVQVESVPAPTSVLTNDSYPFVVPNDPSIVEIIDDIIASGIAEGWTVLGLAADFEDDVLIWWENPEGECECYYMIFTQSRFLPIESCEIGLDAWQECVAVGDCEVSRERKPDKTKGVKSEGVWR